MFLELPSLRFQPKFYNGGVSRFHLPLLCDLAALRRPTKIVLLGFGDGQPHFTFCQINRERDLGFHCLTIRRDLPGENADDDATWQKAVAESDEFYHSLTTLVAGDAVTVAGREADGSVDLLLLDDCDSAEKARAELIAWRPKLSANALVLWHGLNLQRTDSIPVAFEEIFTDHLRAEFPAGIGLGVVNLSKEIAKNDSLGALIFGSTEDRAELTAFYEANARRMEAESRASKAERKNAALELRQIWLDSLVADRWQAQEVMDDQAREIAERPAFAELHRDRMKAQLIMDTQTEQLKQWVSKSEALSSENRKLKKQLAQQKQTLAAAKNACRKGGRCFGEKKPKRSFPERILRELRRIPANLSRSKPEPLSVSQKKTEPLAPVDRYPAWIAKHEPDGDALEEQRRASKSWDYCPTISLLLPTFNPPVGFLDELFASLAAQTYENFEVCVADGSSDEAAKESLKRWQEKEPRLRIEFLPQNLGIAENTNRALSLGSGEFVACIDQDDLLAPFALYEMARAIGAHHEADVFYSDEDRLDADGQRHSPFFKPEWSPEYLLSFMYLGHLTAYRRELMERLGGFRKKFDLSQDYDFALRATEQAREICHVPHVVYHWREHPLSGSAGGKPEARASNLAALDEAMKRRGLRAEILEYPAANRARLKIQELPKVSIIIPTDSEERARACIEHLPQATVYPDYEIILVTNSALAETLESPTRQAPPVRFVCYDKPFNFSDKCNAGARAARGSRLIFFNDDVESGQADWIQDLIEPLENPEVGAVAPKLLYATGRIQHAGLVTGVRGLVGTAAHQEPFDSTIHSNFAQSMRDVSALSAACLAMRRDDFFAVGQFDAVNTPIAHSDLDLSFKVREAGMRCVYTPFTTMIHRGHASIGAIEAEEETKPVEKVSVYFLKRWAAYSCRDPYFTDEMRDWLYADSPAPIRMWAADLPNESKNDNGRALLFVSHDLSWSGAPLILLNIAKWCRARGYFVVLMSPEDGPVRENFVEAGVSVIADPLITKEHPSFVDFAREFDCVIASTIFGAAIVRAVAPARIPNLWWIHEGRVAEHYLGEDPELRQALKVSDLIVTPDTVSAQVYQPFTERPICVLTYGIPDPGLPNELSAADKTDAPINFLLLGTIEQRKGQLVFLEALRKLPADVLQRARFQIVGRSHDEPIARQIETAATEYVQLIYRESVPHTAALELIRAADVMMSCSFDETGPLILMEALALGKPILSTSVGVVSESLTNEQGGLFFPPGDADALAAAIARLVREPQLLARLQRNARSEYEKHFTFERFANDFEKLLQEVIESGESRASSSVALSHSTGA